MRIEKGKDKIIFLSGFILAVVLIILINIFITKANYRKTENIPLAKGTINYTLVDFEIVEITIDGQPSNKMPVGNYELTSDSYCTEKDEQFQDTPNSNIKLTYQNNILSVSNYTKKGTKCHLYFETPKLPSDKTLANLEKAAKHEFTIEEAPSSYKSIDTSDHGNTLYYTEDNDGTSYYYRGAAKNNWLKFGENDAGTQDVWWRIIRINGDGTIRLIYTGMYDKGTNPNPGSNAYVTGTGTLVATQQTYSLYGAHYDNTYVGFYTGTEGGTDYDKTHSNMTASNIAIELKKWYEGINWKDTYNQYIDEDAGFCNDRAKPMFGVHASLFSQGGYGITTTVYGPGNRLIYKGSTGFDSEQTPTLKCGELDYGVGVDDASYKRDLFTTESSVKGNGVLEVPVGLITSDEVIFAGGFGDKGNQSYYLCNNQYFYTMSPWGFYNTYAWVFFINTDGGLTKATVTDLLGVRPVINLKADVKLSGKGLYNDPYTVITE